MIKTISALAIVAVFGAAMPAFAQQTTNSANGAVVDGHGGGGSVANRYHPDGPSGSFVTQASDGTCYLHTGNGILVVRCPPSMR